MLWSPMEYVYAQQEDMSLDSSQSGSDMQASSEAETGNEERVQKGKEAETSGRYGRSEAVFANLWSQHLC